MDIIDSKDLPAQDGFDLRVEMVHDTDATPEGEGQYSKAALKAYYNDEWGFCGLVVTASRAGVDLGEDSVWGCQYGHMPGVKSWINPLGHGDASTGEPESSFDYYGPDLIAEALAQAKDTLARINEPETRARAAHSFDASQVVSGAR